ncbi:hypothetical protein [Bacillus horti]|uniref:ABC-2 type transport system permease protein n=1 Tax=Caldalkalibacillus horti TaxID=77523 RepID=A0ABT9VXA0_9BACI|nr:hypothetical protein [Bacillus horti]MDQ0165616.1 ABC-2 type transport system permease protein [Bacillus horti]
MKRFSVLFKVDLLESMRSLKIIWLPIVFILLGVSQPLSMYYLPQILELVGGLPAEFAFTFPELSGEEVLASTLKDQFDQLGVMVLVISLMSMVAADKNNGMLTFILTRSATLMDYLMSKWLANALIIGGSITVGYVVSYYYVTFLYNSIPILHLLSALGIFLIWLLFILTLTMMLSSMLVRPAAIAVTGILILMIMKLLTVLREEWQIFNPAFLANHAGNVLITGETLSYFWGTLVVAILMIVGLMLMTKVYLSKKELPSM